ncbi:MAG: hypothetical protein AAES65_18405 [Candidatus Thiodiazotropha sp. (ex. Lucinoma kazani)]
MTRARETLVSLEVTPYYHCISRCVRCAWLYGDDPYTGHSFEHRRQWMLDRLRTLLDIFAINVCNAIMSNHYQVVLHVDVDKAKGLTDQQIIEQWNRLYKGHMLADRYLTGEVVSMTERAVLSELIDEWRLRIYDISWFMLCMNEYIAQRANAEDLCKRRFWEGRLKSQAVLGWLRHRRVQISLRSKNVSKPMPIDRPRTRPNGARKNNPQSFIHSRARKV